MRSKLNIFIPLLMVLGAASRLITALPNFSPIVGLALFGAAFLSRKYVAFLLPLVLIYASDFVINNTIARPFFPDVEGLVWYSDYMIWNLIAYVGIIMLGIFALRKKRDFTRVLVVSVTSSVLFFLITNFGVWMDPKSIYPATFGGLTLNYSLALPFFRNSLIGDLFFTGALFGTYALLKHYTFKSADSATSQTL